MGNVIKSDEGWRRFRERTNNGAVKRSVRMNHRPTRKTADQRKSRS